MINKIATISTCFILSASAQAALYWDLDDGNAGATTGTSATGTWDACNSNWNVNADGSGANQTYCSGEDVFFSAGTDATGFSAITVCGTQNVSSFNVEEGIVNFNGGTINFNDASPDITVATGLSATVNSVLTGANGLSKSGNGTIILGGVSTYTGDTSVDAGTVMLGADNVLPDATNLVLNGGTFDANGYDETLNNLTLNVSSVINLAGGNSVLNFGTMNNTAGTLEIWNWDGIMDTPNGSDQIIFNTQFAAGTISNIEFYNDDGNTFVANGGLLDLGNGTWELVAASAVPEASTYVSMACVLATLLMFHFRRKKGFPSHKALCEILVKWTSRIELNPKRRILYERTT